MGTTPTRRVAPALAATAVAALLGTALAAPAAARGPGSHSRMPVTAAARTLGTAVVAARTATANPATTTTTRGARWQTPVRHVIRSATLDPAAAEVVRLVNVARADAGCQPLRVDTRLTTAARLHSQDMADHDYFSHTSLDGRTPWQRMEAQGYTAASGENIAAGYSTPASVMNAWMNSSGHRANILNCSSKAIGVGIGKGGSYGTYWTQDFGYS
jgi:uncharacterized protein YkwD